MNALELASLLVGLAGSGQGHDAKPEDAMKNVSFMVGDWKGKQTFTTPTGTMVGDASDHVEFAVGGRFIEEHLSTTLPNRSPTDTRHMLAYDPKTGKYVAYWFNDTSSLPMILSGKLEGSKLVLQSSPSTAPGAPARPTLRFTYEGSSANELSLTFEMETAGSWQLLFKSVYTK